MIQQLLCVSLPSPVGTCLSLCSENKDLVVVGSENGSLYKCSLQSSLPAPSSNAAHSHLISPIQLVFSPHHGPVYGISASPFHRNLFLSCGTDGNVRLYSLLDVSQLCHTHTPLRDHCLCSSAAYSSVIPSC